MQKEVRLVNDALAIMSMRDSDFDAYSAFGEIVDNSIQAKATRVSIALESEPTSKHGQFEYVRSIAFGDDGTGMDAETLHHCLQLGYSTRYNDRTGIGRFGVGMTLAAINQCRKIEVYSRVKDGKWLYTYADLDDIAGPNPARSSIPGPEERTPSTKLALLAGKEMGSIVIWSKYDRQPASAPIMREEMKKWLGRTFRRFIWDGLEILVDGDPVRVIDPLYLRWDKSRFPNDPPGTEVEPIVMPWAVPDELRKAYGSTTSNITIRLSLADPSNYPAQGAGNTKHALNRYFQDNEGVSILRNGREVFYDVIPHWPGGSGWFKDKDRWWGCEISFEAVLDRAFTVKNIKRGAIPNPDLKRAIFDKIVPTVKTFRDRIDALWLDSKNKKAEEEANKAGPKTGHEASEGIAKRTPTDKSSIDKGKDIDEESKKLVDDLKKDLDEAEKAAWVAKFKEQPFTIMDRGWKSPNFIEAQHLGGSDVIVYNTSHPFFQEVYAILNKLEPDASPEQSAYKLKSLLDLLIIAYSKAEAKFDASMTFTSEDFIENLRLNWGLYLQNYVKTWKQEYGA